MFTWYSEIDPLSTRTCCSLIHALLTLRRVSFALLSPDLIASSKLVDDVELTPSHVRLPCLPPFPLVC